MNPRGGASVFEAVGPRRPRLPSSKKSNNIPRRKEAKKMRRSNEDRIIGLDVHLEQFCRSDPAANPSVLSGVDGKSNSRQVVEYNLFGTVNLLEYCKRAGAGFILLSTSRVYSIAALAKLPIEVEDRA
jgi:nucleoside-diphosphate-sugar epimerase